MKKYCLLVPFILLVHFLFSQSVHVIDSFKKTSDFYSAFNNGNGTIGSSINTTDFQEGNTSLAINYTFNAGTGFFFSILRNYSNIQQDFSFQTKGFSISHKNGNTDDKISIRLWEDANGNGVFDGTDEIYQSSERSLGSSTWTNSFFSLLEFTKLTGTGNNKLDLNRIRAWDIKVNSTTNVVHNGQVLLDKFALETNYTPPTSGDEMLTGSFIQLWNTAGCKCGNWSQAQWDAELQKMKDAQLTSLIVQYSVYGDLSWYSPSSLPFVLYKQTALNRIFAAAEKTGVKIHLGLYFDEQWNSSNKSAAATYTTVLNKHKEVVNELWTLFGNSTAFGGWYIPQELNDFEWQSDPQKILLFNWLKEVTDYLESKTADKPVTIAPFFNLWQPADKLETWYNELLSKVPNLDRVYPQDGVGIGLKSEAYHIPLYFSAIKRACDANGKTFGATIESFHQTSGWPVDDGAYAATSTTINQLKKQLWAASEHNPFDLIQFSWSYMQPDVSTASTQLYNDYLLFGNLITESSDDFTQNDVFVYPNPVLNQFEIETRYDFNSARVFSIDGILLGELDLKKLSLESFSSGIYVVEFEADNLVIRKKLIKK